MTSFSQPWGAASDLYLQILIVGNDIMAISALWAAACDLQLRIQGTWILAGLQNWDFPSTSWLGLTSAALSTDRPLSYIYIYIHIYIYIYVYIYCLEVNPGSCWYQPPNRARAAISAQDATRASRKSEGKFASPGNLRWPRNSQSDMASRSTRSSWSSRSLWSPGSLRYPSGSRSPRDFLFPNSRQVWGIHKAPGVQEFAVFRDLRSLRS